MTDCIFCKIIAKEIPSDVLYEDENTLAFMDIQPVSKGHALVVPKIHTENLLTADDGILSTQMPAVKKVGNALIKAVGAQGMNLSVSNGTAAGQTVFHLHFHLIPRYSNDGLEPWKHRDSEPKTRAEIALAVREQLS